MYGNTVLPCTNHCCFLRCYGGEILFCKRTILIKSTKYIKALRGLNPINSYNDLFISVSFIHGKGEKACTNFHKSVMEVRKLFATC